MSRSVKVVRSHDEAAELTTSLGISISAGDTVAWGTDHALGMWVEVSRDTSDEYNDDIEIVHDLAEEWGQTHDEMFKMVKTLNQYYFEP